MLNITQETIDKFVKEENLKQYLIKVDDKTYDSSNLASDSIDIKESICTDEMINFNRVEKSSITLNLINFDQSIKNNEGKTLEITQVVNGENIQLGKYILNKPEIKNDNLVSLTGYDYLAKFDKDVSSWWNDAVVFPISHKNLLISLCNYCEVQYNFPSTYVNYNFMINKNISIENTTGREFLGYLQEISACFYKVDRGGILKPFEVINSNVKFTYEAGDCIKTSFSDYVIEKIDKLQVRGSTDDVGVIVGTGNNTYVIQANPLMYGLNDAELRPAVTNIFDKIKGFTYVAFNAELKGYPFVEVGDTVTIKTLKNTYTTVLLSRNLKGTGFQKDTIESKGKAKREESRSANQTIKILNQKMSETIDTVEKYQKTLTDVTDGLQTQITQQAGEINIQSEQFKYHNMITNSDFKLWSGTTLTGWKDYSTGTLIKTIVDDSDFPTGKALTLSGINGTGENLFQEFNVSLTTRYIYVSLDIKFLVGTGNFSLPVYYRVLGSSSWFGKNPQQTYIKTDLINKCTRIFFTYDLGSALTLSGLAPRGYSSNSGDSFRINRMFMTTDSPYPDVNLWNDTASNNLISQINLSPTGIKILADKVDITGMVTFNDLSTSGATIINGDNIKTGTLSAIRIQNLQSINGVAINATGDITAINWDGQLVHLTYNNGIVTGWWLENPSATYVNIGGKTLVFKNGLYMSSY